MERTLKAAEEREAHAAERRRLAEEGLEGPAFKQKSKKVSGRLVAHVRACTHARARARTHLRARTHTHARTRARAHTQEIEAEKALKRGQGNRTAKTGPRRKKFDPNAHEDR